MQGEKKKRKKCKGKRPGTETTRPHLVRMENRFFQSQSAIVAVSEVLWSGVIARALRGRMFRRKCYSIRGHAWTQVLLGSRRVGGCVALLMPPVLSTPTVYQSYVSSAEVLLEDGCAARASGGGIHGVQYLETGAAISRELP